MLSRLGYLIPHLCVLGMLVPLGGAFYVQFAEGELPCPLCILQRMAMMLAALGPAAIILRGRSGEITAADLATGYGMSVLAACAGLSMSGRQVLLHIVPPDPGYGAPMFGLHLYSWGVVIFAVVLAVAGLNLVFVRELTPTTVTFAWPSKIVIVLLGTIILANLISVFFQEGLHLTLPDDPVRYQLLDDLGLRRR